jgi:hypothetical protein
MDPINIPVTGIPGGSTQSHPPVIKFQDMQKSIADLIRSPVRYRIGISITQVMKTLAVFLNTLDLNFSQVIGKFPVISIGHVPGIQIEVGFFLILFFHRFLPLCVFGKSVLIIPYQKYRENFIEATAAFD